MLYTNTYRRNPAALQSDGRPKYYRRAAPDKSFSVRSRAARYHRRAGRRSPELFGILGFVPEVLFLRAAQAPRGLLRILRRWFLTAPPLSRLRHPARRRHLTCPLRPWFSHPVE